MRDPNRIDPMLRAIGEYWHKYPDMRLGQVLDNAKFYAGFSSMFYIEDDKLMEGLVQLGAETRAVRE